MPPILRESAYGLGCTTWEVVRHVVLPYTQKGVVGGVMLGLGRALGETMAVTFVIGNSNKLSTSLFAPGTSIASTLANEFGEAADMHMSALFGLGFLLFVITFIVLAIAKVMLIRAEKAKSYEEAECYYVQAEMPSEAVEMYSRAGKWEAAHRVRGTCRGVGYG